MAERVTGEAGTSEEPPTGIQVKDDGSLDQRWNGEKCFEDEAAGVDDGLGCGI